ncbi:hypothetical protein T484DRAFT_1757657 [Baffinella frigidus]|nr:hypothetical protein T484DRAFT_1757657 [Cryptophyta sp. CCMP2293]
MRSFEHNARQYEVQWKHNKTMHDRATTLMPACKLRLLSVTSGASVTDSSTDSSLDQPQNAVGFTIRDGFFHMTRLREALNALDRCGWKRSYHQRMFHEEYLRSATRVFFKTEKPGSFERAHKKVLEVNGWDSLQQEILISTPRRFGKTISISLFCAALMFACPAVECSIYSTCKRISQKLLRNVCKFLDMIYVEMKVAPFKVHRRNQEELNIQGPEGQGDLRTISSYPSKCKTSLGLMSAGEYTQPPDSGERMNTLKHTHESLIVSIAYFQNAHSSSGENGLCMTAPWYFNDIGDCFNAEPLVGEINSILHGQSLQSIDMTKGDFSIFDVKDIAVIVAMVQVGIRHRQYNLISLAGKFAIFRSHFTGIGSGIEWGHHFSAMIQKGLSITPMFDSSTVGINSIWEYLVEVMMKQILVYELVNVNTRSKETLNDAVSRVYLECMGKLKEMCKGFNETDASPTPLNRQIVDHINNGDIPTRHSETYNKSPNKSAIIAKIDLWFSSFVLQRTFGRRVAMTAMPSTYTHSDIREVCEYAWFTPSILDRTHFDTVEFIRSCWKSQYIEQRLLHGVTADLVDSYINNSDKSESLLWSVRGVLWPSMLTLIAAGEYHLNMDAFVQCIDGIHRCFKSHMKFDTISEESLRRFQSGNIPEFRRPTPCIQYWNNSTGKFRGYLSTSSEGTPSSSNASSLSYVNSEETSPEIPDIGDEDRNKLDDLLTKGMHTIEDMKNRFKAYNTRWHVARDKNDVSDIETAIQESIQKYFAVNVHTFHEGGGLPIEVVNILDGLVTPDTYPHALQKLVLLLSKQYAAIVNVGNFATPEIGIIPMGYWDKWPEIMKFFLALLVGSLHSKTTTAMDTLNCKTPWLHQPHNAQDMDTYLNIRTQGAFNDAEHRRFIFPHRCLLLFKELFPYGATDQLKCGYTVAHLLLAITKALDGQEGMDVFKERQRYTFRWPRRGYTSITEDKTIIDHTLCVILILAGVDKFHSSVNYDGVIPPAPSA